METKFQTSFIPKQPITQSQHLSSGVSVVTIISFFIFFLSLASAGGVYVYTNILSNTIAAQDEGLKKSEAASPATTLDTYIRLSNRLKAVKTILHQHVQSSVLFDLLKNNTLPDVRFNDFNLSYGSDGKVTLGMTGQAKGYEFVALQSKAFSDPSLKNIFQSPIFSNLDLDPAGNATFTFTSGIDPSQIVYYTLTQNKGATNAVTASSTSQGSQTTN